jgi:hypothetical protein
MNGLTSRQLWTHDHLARCSCCGAWEVITDAELHLRANNHMPALTHCDHLDPHLTRQETTA